MVKIGILNVSDRASRGEYEDTPGREVKALFERWLAVEWVAEYAVVPDERDTIASTLRRWSAGGCDLIVTTGGTGPAPRDVTVEATEAVCEKLLPGFGERMRSVSLAYTPTAILSRQTAGIAGRCLIVNLPGKPKAIRECLEAVFPAIPYCLDLIGAARIETHAEMPVFRPKS